jgi:hypothetical protein
MSDEEGEHKTDFLKVDTRLARKVSTRPTQKTGTRLVMMLQ